MCIFIHLSQFQKLVAVKVLRNDALAMPGAFEDFVKEVSVMHNLDHPNLIRLFGIVLSAPLMMVCRKFYMYIFLIKSYYVYEMLCSNYLSLHVVLLTLQCFGVLTWSIAKLFEGQTTNRAEWFH